MSNIKIGVICEGPTDFWAIKYFIGAALSERGATAHFIDLHPNMDETRPTGGWGNIFGWMVKNPPRQRIDRYVGGGLFAGNLDAKMCDLFFVQMDSDIIDEEGFTKFLQEMHRIDVPELHEPIERGRFTKRILSVWAKLEECTEAEKKLHVICAAVESTETWCVGVFSKFAEDPETFKGERLKEEFMNALHTSEGRERQRFSTINKDPARRRRYCAKNHGSVKRLCSQCLHFNNVLTEILERMA